MIRYLEAVAEALYFRGEGVPYLCFRLLRLFLEEDARLLIGLHFVEQER